MANMIIICMYNEGYMFKSRNIYRLCGTYSPTFLKNPGVAIATSLKISS